MAENLKYRVKKIVPWLGIILVIVVIACQREDPLVPVTEPRVKMQLIPWGAKSKLNTMIAHNADSLKIRYNKLEATTDPEEQQVLLDELIQLRNDSIQFAEKKALYNKGKVLVEQIIGVGGPDISYLQDSLVTSFGLPLRPQTDTATYYFFYDDLADTLQLVYERNVLQTIDGIRLQMYDLRDSRSTFDSLKIICRKRNCTNNESTIEAYF